MDLVVTVRRSVELVLSTHTDNSAHHDSAMKNALTLIIAVPCIPSTIGIGQGGDLDWVGAFLGVAGLVLFNFSFK